MVRQPAAMADNDSMGDEEQKGSGKLADLGDLVKVESMVQLAFALPLGCVLGWLAGSWVDRHFHQHWIGIVGILLGAVGGFLQIYRTASRFMKRGD
jgi:F0F1-type ATP synthase assembly protein I